MALNREEFDRYNNLCLKAYVAEEENMSQCPSCQSIIEIVLRSKRELAKLEIQTHQKTQTGEVLDYESYCHYSQFRIRCRNCSFEYCAQCKISPYHVGFTCESYQVNLTAAHCHFCKVKLHVDNTSAGYDLDLCTAAECLQLVQEVCRTVLSCGHSCGGLRGESSHLCCLEAECGESKGGPSKEDFCNICWVEGLGERASLQVECGHVFHYHCLLAKMKAGYPGPRITFGFLQCPLCKQRIKHPAISHAYLDHEVLFKTISAKALQRLPLEGMDKHEKLITVGSRYYKNELQFALDSFAFYNCFKCKKPYFGGKRDCENAEEGRAADELVCFDCCDYVGSSHCKEATHREFHAWKCRFCCMPAVWFCWGTTHFCERCHSHKPYEKPTLPRESFPQCKGPATCPLKVAHPPNGPGTDSEFLLGCAMCVKSNGARPEVKASSSPNVSVSEMKAYLLSQSPAVVTEQQLLFVDRQELVQMFVKSLSLKQTRALLQSKGHDISQYLEAREFESALKRLCR